MSMHIVFADGSNPYVRYNMTAEEFASEVLKWSKRFVLTYDGVAEGTIIQFQAAER